MRRRTWKRRSCGRWKRSSSNWAWVSVSWPASSACQLTTATTISTCCSITASCVRLIAIDLKLGKFEAADKGQMELYLGWLHVTSYWTEALPRKELERKLHQAVRLARARLEAAKG